MRCVSLLFLLVSVLPAQSQAVLAALATGSYFPLDVGDRWVYRIDGRLSTAQYQTWRIDRTEVHNGLTYSIIAIEQPGTLYYESWFRADSSGRVYVLAGDQDQLFLDPSGQPSPGAELQVTGFPGAVTAALGTFPDTLSYANPMLLTRETGVLARGLGLLNSMTNLLTGSSGGITQIRTLVEATVAGGIHFPALLPGLKLSIESLTLDVAGGQVTNCAVPCYFAACYLVPGADPPGTYKPCAQARLDLSNWPEGASRSVRLQLMAPDGSAAFDQSLTLDASPTAAVTFIQVPLYSTPNVPLPAGSYRLLATTSDGAAQSSLTVHIQ